MLLDEAVPLALFLKRSFRKNSTLRADAETGASFVEALQKNNVDVENTHTEGARADPDPDAVRGNEDAVRMDQHTSEQALAAGAAARPSGAETVSAAGAGNAPDRVATSLVQEAEGAAESRARQETGQQAGAARRQAATTSQKHQQAAKALQKEGTNLQQADGGTRTGTDAAVDEAAQTARQGAMGGLALSAETETGGTAGAAVLEQGAMQHQPGTKTACKVGRAWRFKNEQESRCCKPRFTGAAKDKHSMCGPLGGDGAQAPGQVKLAQSLASMSHLESHLKDHLNAFGDLAGLHSHLAEQRRKFGELEEGSGKDGGSSAPGDGDHGSAGGASFKSAGTAPDAADLAKLLGNLMEAFSDTLHDLAQDAEQFEVEEARAAKEEYRRFKRTGSSKLESQYLARGVFMDWDDFLPKAALPGKGTMGMVLGK